MKTKANISDSLQPRLRIIFGKDVALGPGKVELLRLIRETHSISQAAREMKMSYMRAWSLIQTMNRCFRSPVIHTTRGGQIRGGASLTDTGEKVLALFEQLEAECLTASEATRKKIGALLKRAG